MRVFLYWLTSTAIAVLAAGASEQVADGAVDPGILAMTNHVLPAQDPSRAVLLGIGIMAMAFTYRQAWMNWKRQG